MSFPLPPTRQTLPQRDRTGKKTKHDYEPETPDDEPELSGNGARDGVKLHQLLAQGKDDASGGHAIRTTGLTVRGRPSRKSNVVGSATFRKTSTRLPSPLPRMPMNAQAQAKLLEAFEARERGEWDRALDLLRRWQAYIEPSLVSYLRGSIWLEAGDADTAAIFYRHAYELDHERQLSRDGPLLLKRRRPIGRLAGSHRDPEGSREILPRLSSAGSGHHVNVCSAEIRNRSRSDVPPIGTDSGKHDRPDGKGDPNELDRTTYVTLLSLSGFGYEFLGNTQAALAPYLAALQIEPTNDALYVARGMLLYGTSARAITDLEIAMQYGTSLVWPYVMLAHHHLLAGRFEESRLREQAIRLGGSAAVMSQVWEWMAISQTHLGFAADVVRASFDNAIRLDPVKRTSQTQCGSFRIGN